MHWYTDEYLTWSKLQKHLSKNPYQTQHCIPFPDLQHLRPLRPPEHPGQPMPGRHLPPPRPPQVHFPRGHGRLPRGRRGHDGLPRRGLRRRHGLHLRARPEGGLVRGVS